MGYLDVNPFNTGGGGGSGTVTSVAMTVPSFLSVSGSPITTSGTLAVTLSGTALPISSGGTGQTTASAAFGALSPLTTKGDILAYSTANARLPVGTDGQVLSADSTATTGLKWITVSGTGTVTSVAMTVPAFLSVSGSPITGAGTLAVSLSGTALPLANGGTGQTTKAAAFDALSPMSASGDIIYGGTSGTGTRLAKGTDGQVLTLASGLPSWATPTTGTVTSVAMTVPSFLSVSGSPITSSGTLAVSLSGTALPIANGGTGSTSLVTAATASSVMGRDSNANTRINNITQGYTTTVTAAGTTTLTVGSTYNQYFTGSSTQTVKLPDATTLPGTGYQIRIVNISVSSVFVQDSAGGALVTMPGNTIAIFTALSVATAAGSWDIDYKISSAVGTLQSVAMTVPSFLSVSGSPVTGTSGTLAVTLSGTALPIANGGTGQTTASAAFGALSPLTTKGDLLAFSTSNVRLPVGTDGQILSADSTQTTGLKWIAAGGTGTVTSVAMTVPAFLSVSGSPVTTSGTLAVSLSGTALPLANGGTGQTTKSAAFDALSPMTTSGDIIYGGTAGTGTRLAKGTDGQVLTLASGLPSWATPTTGTVTSVAMSVPSFLSVSGSPITSSGTLAVTLSGTALPIANGGTGQTTASAAFGALSPLTTKGDILAFSTSNARLPVGTDGQILSADSTQTTGLKWIAAGGTGTVTSVAMSVPAFLSVSGSPITSSGTLAVSLSGTALPLANGGTGQTTKAAAFDALSPMSASGDIIYGGTSGTGTRLAKGTDGQVLTLASGLPSWATPTTGTVTSVAMSVPAFLSVSGSPVTSSGTLAVSLSGTALPVANGGTGVTSVTTAATATAFAGWDANKNLSANSHIDGYTTTATAAGTTTLTVGSTKLQYFTGSTTQTVTMPAVSTLVTGQQYTIVNLSSGTVTVQSSGANTIQAMAANTQLVLTCISTSGTGTASWSWSYGTLTAVSGTVTSVAMTVPSFLSVSGSPVTSSGTLAVSLSGTALPVANGGTGLTSGTSGGILGYTASGTLASSAALTANQLIIGGGAGATPSTLAAGSQYQVLVMGASNPGYGQVNLAQSAAITGTLPVANGGTGNTSLSFSTLTDGATITWTVAGLINSATVTLGGNRTLAFSGIANGMSGTLIVKQDATGSRTLTLPAGSKVIGGGGGAISLTTTANAIDIITFYYDGTNYYWTYGKNYT